MSTKNRLKVGDRVKILRKTRTHERGWHNSWESPEMDVAVGKIGKVVYVDKTLKYDVEVRKESDHPTSRYKAEGYRNTKQFIILDDTVETYTTAVRIYKGVLSIAPSAKLIGVFEYIPMTFEHGDRVTETIKRANDPTWHGRMDA